MGSQPLNVPEMVTRSSGISSNFLCDNANIFLELMKMEQNQELWTAFMQQRKSTYEFLRGKGEMAKAICALL